MAEKKCAAEVTSVDGLAVYRYPCANRAQEGSNYCGVHRPLTEPTGKMVYRARRDYTGNYRLDAYEVMKESPKTYVVRLAGSVSTDRVSRNDYCTTQIEAAVRALEEQEIATKRAADRLAREQELLAGLKRIIADLPPTE